MLPQVEVAAPAGSLPRRRKPAHRAERLPAVRQLRLDSQGVVVPLVELRGGFYPLLYDALLIRDLQAGHPVLAAPGLLSALVSRGADCPVERRVVREVRRRLERALP